MLLLQHPAVLFSQPFERTQKKRSIRDYPDKACEISNEYLPEIFCADRYETSDHCHHCVAVLALEQEIDPSNEICANLSVQPQGEKKE